MAAKGKFVVLRRVRGGDTDLVATLYGTPGRVTLFLKDGYINENKLFGVFEPFNFLEVSYTQSGSVIFPSDVRVLRRFSLRATRPATYFLMSRIAAFFLRYISFHDEELLSLLVSYLSRASEEEEYLFFLVDYLRISGFRPRFLGEPLEHLRERVRVRLSDGSVDPSGEYELEPRLLGILKRIYEGKRKRLRVSRALRRDLERFLQTYIEYHLKETTKL